MLGSVPSSQLTSAQLPMMLQMLGSLQMKTDVFLLWTDPNSWNENDPFPTRDKIPQLDRKKKTVLPKDVDVERPGPFPIAAAIEVTLPSSWFDKKKPPTVRLAVIGQGLVFQGAELKPMQEKLLIDVTNWLLGRDDLLIRSDPAPWRFPRVQLDEQENLLWQWGVRLGLPALFAYLGVFMFLVRRMR